MCSVCYGIGNCPVCEPPDEPDFERMLDDELDAADDWYNEMKLNEQTEQP